MEKNRSGCSETPESSRWYPPITLFRSDYKYVRNGTASIFSFTEQLGGLKKVYARKQGTKVEWVHEVRELLETDCPNARKIIFVCDNLNSYTIGSFYAAFPPAEHSMLVKPLEIHLPP
jgi:hypothetical protein